MQSLTSHRGQNSSTTTMAKNFVIFLTVCLGVVAVSASSILNVRDQNTNTRSQSLTQTQQQPGNGGVGLYNNVKSSRPLDAKAGVDVVDKEIREVFLSAQRQGSPQHLQEYPHHPPPHHSLPHHEYDHMHYEGHWGVHEVPHHLPPHHEFPNHPPPPHYPHHPPPPHNFPHPPRDW